MHRVEELLLHHQTASGGGAIRRALTSLQGDWNPRTTFRRRRPAERQTRALGRLQTGEEDKGQEVHKGMADAEVAAPTATGCWRTLSDPSSSRSSNSAAEDTLTFPRFNLHHCNGN